MNTSISNKNSFVEIVLFASPIINAIADVTTNYFPANSINPGFFRFVILGTIVLILLSNKTKKSNESVLLLILLAYFGISTLLNGSFIISYASMSLGFSGFLVGLTYCNSIRRYKRLLDGIFIAICIIILNYFIAQIFNLGKSTYVEDSFYLGGAGGGLTSQLSILLGIIPILFSISENRRKRIYILIVTVFAIVIIIVVLRRTAILILSFGAIVFVLFSYKNKFNSIIGIFSVCVILFALSPFYFEIFSQRLEGREILDRDIEREARYLEVFVVTNIIFNESTINNSLFGYGLFEGRGLVGYNRSLHVGYIEVLYGSGILGLFLFLIYHLQIFIKGFKLKLLPILNGKLVVSFLWVFGGILIYYLTGRISGIGIGFNTYLLLGSFITFNKTNLIQVLSILDSTNKCNTKI